MDALPSGAVVVDVGGGRHCSFAHQLRPDREAHVVAVDISPEELAANTSVDETRVADVVEQLPFADGEVDLVVSRTLLEHVQSVERAACEMARVLRPGGRSIHLVPCRYSLFAIGARLLPFALLKRTLQTLLPETRGVIEFDVVYDRGHPSALKDAFHLADFARVDLEYTWDQSGYFHWFFPAFVLVLAYQRAVEILNLTVLASYVVIRAER